jgi:group I intron endonuclease
MAHYVYKITNTVNGKIYIGKSVNPKARWAKHISSAKLKPTNQFFYLQASINKYGKDYFTLDIIDECESAEKAYNREVYWISHYNSNNRQYGMNLTVGGDGSRGHVLSKEARDKISKANTGLKRSIEHREAISKGNKGRVVSDDVRKRISIAQIGPKNHRYGKTWSEEDKKRISEQQRGKVVSEDTRNKMRESAIIRFENHPVSEETRKKISIARAGKAVEFGENHHAAKLKETDVRAIRQLHSDGMRFADLARKFGVRHSTIGKIVKFERWKHVQ